MPLMCGKAAPNMLLLPWRGHVTTSLFGKKKDHNHKNLTKYTEPQRWLFVGCLTSQQQASVSQGRICSDKFTCCHTEIEAADPTFYLTQSQYTDTRPTSPSADPMAPGRVGTGMTRPRKIPAQAGFEPWILHSQGRRLTTRPQGRYPPRYNREGRRSQLKESPPLCLRLNFCLSNKYL